MSRRPEHPLERALSVSGAEYGITPRSMGKAPWADFLLYPRRLRGSDFLMRWSQGVWSEERPHSPLCQVCWRQIRTVHGSVATLGLDKVELHARRTRLPP